MRLDEHGRWVSDDGAYVWDEAAQTWQQSSAAPSPGAATTTTATTTAGGASAAPAGSSTPATAVRFGTAPRGRSTAGNAAGPDRSGGDAGSPAAAGSGAAGAAGAAPGTQGLPPYGGTGHVGRWGGALERGSQPGQVGQVEQASSPTSGLSRDRDPLGLTTGSSVPPAEASDPAHPRTRSFGGPDPRGADPLAFSARSDPATGPSTSSIPITWADPTGPDPRAVDAARAGAVGVAGPADETGPSALAVSWGAGAPTGEIHRVNRRAATGSDDEAEPDLDDRSWDDDPAEDFDEEPSGAAFGEHDDEGDDGWSPSGPGASRRAVPGRGGSGGALGRARALARGARGRPPVLIGAVIVVLCLGLGIIGFLALGGGSHSGSSADTAAAGKGRYAPAVRQAYLSSCLDVSNGNEGYCTCTLEKLEAGYTQEEYQRFSDNVQSDSSQRIVREIYTACRDKR